MKTSKTLLLAVSVMAACLIAPCTRGGVMFTTLYNFVDGHNGGNDGSEPDAGLVQGTDGNFYGTTSAGGIPWQFGNGTVFEMTTNGTLRTLYAFTGGSDGRWPQASLLQGVDGNFYGATTFGGNTNIVDSWGNLGAGTIFKISTNGILTTLHVFTNGNDGGYPRSGLVQGSDGCLYGTTTTGGDTNIVHDLGFDNIAIGSGTIFRITTNGTLTTLHIFSGDSEGWNPFAALVIGDDGNLYGTTYFGGPYDYGTVFKVMTNGTFTTLTNFNGTNGANPSAALMRGNDGSFYGSAEYGGPSDYQGPAGIGYGTLFRFTPNGNLTTLVAFNGSNGANPVSSLLQGTDGNVYGTTCFGGANTDSGGTTCGTVFMICTNGTLVTLYSFADGNDGEGPLASLVQGTDGSFYGTAVSGGDTFGDGTIFRLSVLPGPLITTASSLPSGTLDMSYSQTLTAIDGTTPYTWSLIAGSLPAGVSLNTNGVISGIPTTATNASFTVRVMDNNGLSATNIFSLAINTVLDNWTARISQTQLALYGVAYGNGTFVAVGDSGPTGYQGIQTSPDGVNWRVRTPIFGALHGITFGNGVFVAVGAAGIATSSNGISWTNQIVSFGDLLAIAYGNGTFVAVSDNGTIVTSPDGVNWTPQNSGLTNQLALDAVAYGNNTFVVVGGNGGVQEPILTSTNGGITWTSHSVPLYGNTDLNGVAYGNGTFVVVGWVLDPISENTGGTMLTSPDGINWSIQEQVSGNSLEGVGYVNNTFIAVGDNGAILTSPDSSIWTARNSGTDETLYSVAYGNGTYVAVGGGGTILTANGASISTNPSITMVSPLPNGTVGTAYSEPLTATGGTMPYTWSLASGSLPAGLSLSTNGIISGTPSAVTTASFTVQVMDNHSLSATNTFSLTINPAPTKTIGLSGNLAFGNVTVNTTAQQTLTINNNGNALLTVSSISYPAGFSGAWSGSIPAGSATNVTVTFAPTAATSYGGTVTVSSDATSGTSTITASGTGIVAPTKIIGLSGNLAFGNVTVNATAQQTLTITNSGNASLTVSSISYPAGFSGAWSGSIPAGTAANITVTFAPTATTSYGGTVAVSSDATSGTSTITASGTGIVAPTKIIGLSGNLAFGNVTLNLKAQRTLTITNCGQAPLTVSTIYYPSGLRGVLSGVWSGSIPPGGFTNVIVTFAPTAATSYGGTITVVSDATSGTSTITASGTGMNIPDAYWSGTWVGTYSADCSYGNCTWTNNGNAILTLSVSNGVVSGNGSEDGVACINGNTCEIMSYETMSGSLTGTVSGTTINLDGNWLSGCNGQSYDCPFGGTLSGRIITGWPSLTLQKQVVSPTITTTSPLPSGTVGTAYNQTLQATNGTAPYIWSLTSGSLPVGLSLSNNGVISGTPSSATTASFTVQVMDNNSLTATSTFGLTVNPAPSTLIVLTSDASTLAAALGSGAYSDVVFNQLDSGGTTNLTFQAAEVGAFGTWTPIPVGSPSGTEVINIPPGDGESGFFKILFVLPAGFQNIQLAGAANVDDYGRAFLNGNPISSSMSSSDSGRIAEYGDTQFSTTNAAYFQAGTNELVIADANTGGPSGAAFYADVTYYVPVQIVTTSLPSATQNAPYSATLAATGGDAPYTWSLASGSLPAGLSLSTNGVISGTPSTATTASFTVQVMDNNSLTATNNFSLTINSQGGGCTNWVNFDTLSNWDSGVVLSNYLSGFGITISGVTPGVTLYVGADFPGGLHQASSGQEFLWWGGPNDVWLTFTMNFSQPLTSFSFTRCADVSGPIGSALPAWNVTVYQGGTVIGTAGESAYSIGPSGPSDPAQIYSFTGSGITSVTFSANTWNVAAVPSPGIDDIIMTTALQTITAPAQGTTVYPIVTNGSATQYSGGLATDGTNYLFVFSSGTNNCAQLVSSNGTLIGSPIILSGGAVGMPPQLLVVSGQTNYLVVWSDISISSGVDIFGQFISRGGANVGSKFPLLQSVGSHGFQGIESLACDGTNFLVIWQDEKGLITSHGASTNVSYCQLITSAGALSGSEFAVATVVAPLQAQGIGVAFGKTNYLAVWQSGSNNYDSTYGGQYIAYGAFISSGGAVGSRFVISQTNSPDNNDVATAVFDGTNFLAIWNVNPGLPNVEPIDWRVHGRLVTPQGCFPANELVLVNESNAAAGSLSFDGANYLAGWGYHLDTTNSDKNIHLRFFDRNANPVGPVFSVFSSQGTNAPLAPGLFNGIVFDGKRFAIAGILGTVSIGTNGTFQGIPSAQVYGAFIPASTAPPQFCAGANCSDNQFSLTLSGTPGINYAIEMTTNLLAPNWTLLITNSPTDGPFTFTDPGATNGSRFYRAVKQ